MSGASVVDSKALKDFKFSRIIFLPLIGKVYTVIVWKLLIFWNGRQ